jgi:hypothetical protein
MKYTLYSTNIFILEHITISFAISDATGNLGLLSVAATAFPLTPNFPQGLVLAKYGYFHERNPMVGDGLLYEVTGGWVQGTFIIWFRKIN